MLFPVLAWQTKLLLDAEPDVQRRLARLAVGAGREAAAGLLAAAVLGLVVCAVAMARARGRSAPSAARSSPASRRWPPASRSACWRTCWPLPAAVALGALASRAVTRSIRNGRRGAGRPARCWRSCSA